MKQLLLLILTSLLLLTASLFSSERVQANSDQRSALEVIEAVNRLRASHGVPPYQINTILMGVAQSHADYIASTGVSTHFGANGEYPYQRAIAAGYAVAGDLSLGGFFSENIHAGAALSASAAVADWQGDTPHLNTMISPDLRDIGVGISIVDGITYYVLDAGASTGDPIIIQTSSSAIATSTVATPGAPGTALVISTPLENGEVYHVVQLKEALWSIALAYNTTVEQIKLLNGLATDEIFEGQKLLIQRPVTDTPTPTAAVTATFGIPTSTATLPVSPTSTLTPTPVPAAPATPQSGGMIVGAIILIALFAAGVGAWLGRKKLT